MLLHPLRGTADIARLVVEGGTHAHHQRLHAVLVYGHPALLLRRAQAHPDKIGLSLIDHPHHVLVLLGRQRAEWRGVHSRNDSSWIILRDFFPQHIQRFLRGAVEIMAVMLGLALLQQLLHQVGAGHAGRVHVPLLAAVFRERAAVRQGHDCAVLHLLVVGVLVGCHSGVDVCHADVFPAPIFQFFLDEAQGLVHIGHDDVHAHDVAGVHQPQIHVPHTADAVQFAAGGHKVVVHRHRRHPQVEVISQQHNTAHFLGVLHILGQHQHFNFLGAHDLKQVGHRAAVVG